MAFVRTRLMPRVAFWLIWTAWLWCLQSFLLARWEALPGHLALLVIVGPPLFIAWIGSRLVKNPLDSPNPLFWKGAALSGLLGAFASLLLMKEMGWGPHVLIGAGLICGYLGLRGAGLKKVALTRNIPRRSRRRCRKQNNRDWNSFCCTFVTEIAYGKNNPFGGCPVLRAGDGPEFCKRRFQDRGECQRLPEFAG